VNLRICRTCNKSFKPSSGHLNCPPCRKKLIKRKVCPDCHGKMWPTAQRCRKCSTKTIYNGNWRGGKTRQKAGYILIRVPSHPRAKANNQYVFEHILVIEEKLGRYLLPEERIHHKNGIKSDNRLENLEVWTVIHPAGCRVSDLVEWAKEILKLYS